MIQYLSVVVGVFDAFFEVDEELTCVTDAADQEPDRRDDSHDARNDQRRNEKLDRPPLVRPRVDCVPDHNRKEDDPDLVDNRITEDRIGDDLVPERIFLRDADDSAEDIPERPAFFRRLGSVRIDAAVQKFVKIVRLVGEVRADDVTADGEDHGYEVNLERIDRELDGVHAPCDPRVERRGDRFEEGVQRLDHADLFQHGVDALRPVALENQSEQGSARPENDRAPCAGQIPETAVKSEDHDRARAAEPYRAHDRREHVDVVQLGEENRHDQEKDRHADARQAQEKQMFFLVQMPFEHRQDHVLHQRRGSVENAAVVRGDQQHDHQEAEQPEHSHREDFADHGRHHHLLVKRTVFLELIARLGRVSERVPHRVEIRRIGIFLLGKRLFPLLCREGFRNPVNLIHDLRSDRLVGNDTVQNLRGEFLPDLRAGDLEFIAGMREMRTRHEHDHHNRQQQDHHIGKTVLPGAEHARHLLLVRRPAGPAGIVPNPARTVQDGTEQSHDQRENIEIAKLRDVIRIHETLPRNTVPHDRRNVVRPREIQDDVSHDDHENRVAEKSLETVRNQKGNAPARPDEHHRKAQTERHDDHVTRQIDPHDRDPVRKPEVVDEKIRRDGGADGVCDHLRNRAQNRTENTEKLAPVTQFEELPHGETTCFAPAVQTISGQCHEYADGSRNRPPETHREPGLVILLRPCDERNHGQSRGHIPDRHHIPSRDPPRRKEIHHAARILPRIDRHPDQQHDRDDYNTPVNPFHLITLP